MVRCRPGITMLTDGGSWGRAKAPSMLPPRRSCSGSCNAEPASPSWPRRIGRPRTSISFLGIGIGRLRLRAPCRVVYLVDEPEHRGFAYGTLPGHPESGEERFTVEFLPDGRVELTILAFSKPAVWWSRLGGPVNRLAQSFVTARYLRALGQ